MPARLPQQSSRPTLFVVAESVVAERGDAPFAHWLELDERARRGADGRPGATRRAQTLTFAELWARAEAIREIAETSVVAANLMKATGATVAP